MSFRQLASTVEVRRWDIGEAQQGFQPVRLETARGAVACRYYPSAAATRGAIWVGGVGGGWDTPARGLYPRLCQELVADGIASLRVRFRHSAEMDECVHDVLAGLRFLEEQGITAAALTGHSLGGAVVIRAAAQSRLARTVVTLASQSYGGDPVSRLGPDCSILLIHGTRDRILPYVCSEHLYDMAQEPRRLELYEGADHVLDESAEEIYQTVHDWIVRELANAGTLGRAQRT